ncbi:Cof-type HAD-IIB family hydrolase [Alicyclobacillus tolerans]|uniref:Cof-type HAD-IIB family hydrolase n=1 Tax=Alicyclobacillus tolerans TaxID=90970 RepID=UPI001F00CB3A|nr:Cof-type HAD-IIB family hydrolase [Alicyclobacillus tolerans]MCF8566661.1 Cof-type HAD-IIB family hydrolase [Alicyclobacillus tolerans]
MYKIAFFDVDGTLLNTEQKVPQSTIEAIQQLKHKGIEPVIATGRPPYHMQELAEEIGITSSINVNGGIVIYQGEVLFENPLQKRAIDNAVEIAGVHGHPLIFCGLNDSYATVKDNDTINNIFDFFHWKAPLFDPAYYQQHPVYQIQAFCTPESRDAYQSLSHVRTYPWSIKSIGFDILPAGNSKASAIDQLLGHLRLTREESIAFGDGFNDVEMIQAVGLGIAMGNAKEVLKEHADYVTKSVDEDGIFHALQALSIV